MAFFMGGFFLLSLMEYYLRLITANARIADPNSQAAAGTGTTDDWL
jgi:hypothetical protein